MFKKIFVGFVSAIVIVFAAVFTIGFFTTVNVSNTDELKSYITQNSGFSNFEIVKTANSRNMYAALIQRNSRNSLVLLEKSGIFPNKFKRRLCKKILMKIILLLFIF